MPQDVDNEQAGKLNPEFISPSKKKGSTTDREGPISVNLPCTYRIARMLGRNFTNNKSLTELRIVGILISQEGWSDLALGLEKIPSLRLLLINF